MLKKKSNQNQAPIWRDVAERLCKPKRRRIAVNVSRITRNTTENDKIVVPGKVLGAGIIKHPVNVAALGFSDQARKKIVKAKGKCMTIAEMAEANPKGTGVKIIG